MTTRSFAHTVRQEVTPILIFLGVIWLVFLLSLVTPIENLGLRPRTAVGLLGLITMPFLHSGVGHILSNTIPLFVLLCLLAGSQVRTWETVLEITLFSGGLLWFAGRPGNHVGASALIFGLMAFLMLAGFLERRLFAILVALLTLFLYGGTLFWGVLPLKGGISWDGHLCGVIAGGLLALRLVRRNAKVDR